MCRSFSVTFSCAASHKAHYEQKCTRSAWSKFREHQRADPEPIRGYSLVTRWKCPKCDDGQGREMEEPPALEEGAHHVLTEEEARVEAGRLERWAGEL